jgi:4-amino-4-deoxy-L-arabinose transferase-like glycosyltransferase
VIWPGSRRRAVLGGFAVGVLLTYAACLGSSPIYLHHDEVFFARQASSIADTGRDLNGRLLPLYFQISGRVWFHPVLVYAMAPFLKVLPLTEWSIRLPTVAVGVLNIVLVYFAARRLFPRERSALLAAGLLALSPAHFIQSRLAMDYTCPLPFVLGWLLCMLSYSQRPRPGVLFGGSLLLGLGFYSYLASVVMMPVYLVLTMSMLVLQRAPLRAHAVALLGFLLPLLFLVPWFLYHPEAYSDTVARYGVYDSNGLSVLQGIRNQLHYLVWLDRLSNFWTFFNPNYLFFSGGGSIVNSTRKAGVFLVPVALFLAVGINEILNFKRAPINLLVLAGFVTAPFAALMVAERYAIDREMAVVPFGILTAMFGVERMLASPRRAWRAAALGMLAWMPIQFGYFCADYFTDYRTRSAFWFDRNTRGAVTAVIDRNVPQPRPAIYLSTTIPFIDAYWPLYLKVNKRTDLELRTVYFDAARPDGLKDAPQGSIILANAGDKQVQGLAAGGLLVPAGSVMEPDGSVSFLLFTR